LTKKKLKQNSGIRLLK